MEWIYRLRPPLDLLRNSLDSFSPKPSPYGPYYTARATAYDDSNITYRADHYLGELLLYATVVASKDDILMGAVKLMISLL